MRNIKSTMLSVRKHEISKQSSMHISCRNDYLRALPTKRPVSLFEVRFRKGLLKFKGYRFNRRPIYKFLFLNKFIKKGYKNQLICKFGRVWKKRPSRNRYSLRFDLNNRRRDFKDTYKKNRPGSLYAQAIASRGNNVSKYSSKRLQSKTRGVLKRLVLHKGTWQFIIQKGGRTLYRPLRLRDYLPEGSFWRTREFGTRKKRHKCWKARFILRWLTRSRNRYDTRLQRRRKLYKTTQRISRYIKWKFEAKKLGISRYACSSFILRSQHFGCTLSTFYYQPTVFSNLRWFLGAHIKNILFLNTAAMWSLNRTVLNRNTLLTSLNRSAFQVTVRPVQIAWNIRLMKIITRQSRFRTFKSTLDYYDYIFSKSTFYSSIRNNRFYSFLSIKQEQRL